MVTSDSPSLLRDFMRCVEHDRTIKAVVLFGSRVHPAAEVNAADAWSDYDLQVITSRAGQFASDGWARRAFPHLQLRAYAFRPVPGGVKKVTAIFRTQGELDIVVLPSLPLHVLRLAVALGLHRRVSAIAALLDEVATVMRPGHRLLKGGASWQRFYTRVVAEVRGTRLPDDSVQRLAGEFVCDYLWTIQKIERGELVTAQRMIHRSLAEINFQLLHELRLRRALPSFREARRIERTLSPDHYVTIAVRADLTAASLRGATDQCAATFRGLMVELVGDRWRWPD